MTRLEFDAMLKTIGPTVYADPPTNTKIEYPAIVYNLNNISTLYANNEVYITNTSMNVVLISKRPMDPAIYEIVKLKKCKHERSYVVDTLYHNAFTIYL